MHFFNINLLYKTESVVYLSILQEYTVHNNGRHSINLFAEWEMNLQRSTLLLSQSLSEIVCRCNEQ